MARYLYADSEPFPHDYDFLGTLEGFLRCAAACLLAAGEIDQHKDERRKRADDTVHALEHLDAFATEITQAIDGLTRRSAGGKVVEEPARRIQAEATRTLHDAKVSRRGEAKRLDEEAEEKIEALRGVIREAVSAFFVQHHVDFVKSSFRLGLEDHGYVMRAVCASPTNVEVAYRLDPERTERWREARRVADLVGDQMELQVGMKKKFLRRDLTREIVRIDDYWVTGAELDPFRAEIRLARKPDATRDHLLLTIEEAGGELSVEIRKLGQDDASAFPAVADDIEKVGKLWQGLRQAADEALEHRRSVDWVKIDGKNLYEHDLVALMVDRFVDLYAPVVDQIASRGSSDKELSLKRELADGRREELYLRKEALADLLAPLDESHLRLFARLEVFPTVQLDVD